MPATYGFLSTYPPTQCGLATFNAALATHLNAAPAAAAWSAVAGDDKGGGDRPERAAGGAHLAHRHAGGWTAAANALNRFDVAIVQHEYGIYPATPAPRSAAAAGAEGADIVVLHTVLSTPDALQRSVLERIVTAADAVVTMTDTARQRLIAGTASTPPRSR